VHPILLRWGGHSLYTYSVLVCLGILLGGAYAQWQGYKAGLRGLQMLDVALWLLAGGLVGARGFYVISNWADYASRPFTALAVWSNWGGGLVFQGGLLSGLLALWLYSLRTKLSLTDLMDWAAPAVALAQGLGWVGALLHGANYGIVMPTAFSLWLPDLYGVYGPRIPTQLLAALLGLLLCVALHRLSTRGLRSGMLAWIYLWSNGLGHLLLEFARADETPRWGAWRVTQWFELIEVLGASALMLCVWRQVAARRRRRRRDAPLRED
jgi:phosphatidylglycerol:prolipoprotein diacylglycerol transferase